MLQQNGGKRSRIGKNPGQEIISAHIREYCSLTRISNEISGILRRQALVHFGLHLFSAR